MYRATSNPHEYTCICGSRFMQNHLNRCILPYMSTHCPELLHHKLTTVESILNHNKMELFHVITAIGQQCCSNEDTHNIHPALTATLRYVLQMDLIHLTHYPVLPHLTQSSNNSVAIVDPVPILTISNINEISRALHEFLIELVCLFIPTSKLDMLTSLPHLTILFTTEDDHPFIANPYPISYSLVVSCREKPTLMSLLYQLPTLYYTLSSIGRTSYISPLIIKSNKTHSARTTCIRNPSHRDF